VLEEMKELDTLGSLRQLSDDVLKEAGMSIAQAEFWSDTFDRLAVDLVPPPQGEGGGQGCGPPRESLPPEVVLEGHYGHAIKGRLTAFAPDRDVVQIIPSGQSRPALLRTGQFRRLCQIEPLRALAPLDLPDVGEPSWERPSLPFEVNFHQGAPWIGQTVGHHESSEGLYLFEPFDTYGGVRRWFVPRSAYAEAAIGLRLGEALIEQEIGRAHV
jgi:hypothetical protein